MNSFWNSSTTGPSIRRGVSRQAAFASGPSRRANDPPECTRLKLIQPTNAVWPSITSSVRWSRLLTSHSFLDDSIAGQL
jgi:hypothetical protein